MEGFEKRWARDLHREIRRNARAEWRRQQFPGARSATGGFVFGIVIVVAGILMLLDNFGILRAHTLWDYAPLILVAIGLARIIEGGPTAGMLFGGILTTGGTLWFLHNIDVLRIDPRFVWPVALIGVGIVFLVRAVEQQWWPVAQPPPDTDATGAAEDGTSTPPAQGSRAQVNIATVFGGVKRFVDSPDFRTADLFACFGGIDIDFRAARIPQQQAVIDANAVFGGIDIKVPRTWFVEVRGTGFFGGYEDKTLHPDESAGPAPRLIITGVALFGGISVKSV